MKKKVCFVLGSGGSRGVAHVGFLQAMEENGIKPDCIVGCSMGAVVGASYASGASPKDIKKVAENIKFSDIVDWNWSFYTKKGLLRSVKMRQRLIELIQTHSFNDLKIPFECVAVDIISGKPVTLRDGDLIESVCASSAIPSIFKSVHIGNMELIDGGTLIRVPTDRAKDFNADVVIAVDVLGKLKEFTPTRNILQQIARIVDICDYSNTVKYLKSHKPDVLVCPELGNLNQYKVDNLVFAYEQGYSAGIENLEAIKSAISGKK